MFRSEREAASIPEGATRYRLALSEACVESWARSRVRALVALVVVCGVTGGMALVTEIRDGGWRLEPRWLQVLVGALIACPLVAGALVAASAVRRIRDRDRAIEWSNREITAWVAGQRLAFPRDALRAHAWRDVTILSSPTGEAVAVPRVLAVRAGVTRDDWSPDD